jgi:signal peptidase I
MIDDPFSTPVAAPSWRPRPWLAALLGLILGWAGALYAGSVRWAIAWFAFLVGWAVFGFVVDTPPAVDIALALSVPIVAAIHAYRLAKRRPQSAVRPRASGLRAVFVAVSLLVGFALLIRAFVVEPFRAPSRSMEPTIRAGSALFVTKWGYGHYSVFGATLLRTRGQAIERGRIIAFEFPVDPSLDYVKRVIGVPGDRVVQEGDRFYVNDVPLAVGAPRRADADGQRMQVEQFDGVRYETWPGESGGSRVLGFESDPFPHRELCEKTATSLRCIVPPDHYFVVGDNRDNSSDSRLWGFVPARNVIGTVIEWSR